MLRGDGEKVRNPAGRFAYAFIPAINTAFRQKDTGCPFSSWTMLNMSRHDWDGSDKWAWMAAFLCSGTAPLRSQLS